MRLQDHMRGIVVVIALIAGMFLVSLVGTSHAFAQDPAAETVTPEPTVSTPGVTPSPPTPTQPQPTATFTLVPSEEPAEPTATLTPRPTPAPVPIPEPVTVVLFGTGLAALSAAVAARRK
ncbi:MAG: PEP-CTERM sorting domain-containing protein [Caldilineaceae bacterium]|nr:PEP-CTERM sorting domain-containing protein [Caldilineaceae bacterium]